MTLRFWCSTSLEALGCIRVRQLRTFGVNKSFSGLAPAALVPSPLLASTAPSHPRLDLDPHARSSETSRSILIAACDDKRLAETPLTETMRHPPSFRTYFASSHLSALLRSAPTRMSSCATLTAAPGSRSAPMALWALLDVHRTRCMLLGSTNAWSGAWARWETGSPSSYATLQRVVDADAGHGFQPVRSFVVRIGDLALEAQVVEFHELVDGRVGVASGWVWCAYIVTGRVRTTSSGSITTKLHGKLGGLSTSPCVVSLAGSWDATNGSNTPSPPAPQASAFINQPASATAPLAPGDGGDLDTEEATLKRAAVERSVMEKRMSRTGTMKRESKFPTPVSSPTVPDAPDVPSIHRVVTPSNIEVPPSPPVEKELGDMLRNVILLS
ncbi:hypothetical protein C8R47DRAFT_1297790 [Mycena vitilis]|nr:hypothetical protein C8R47DRAFT_1297790 [Mycena vitilis]